MVKTQSGEVVICLYCGSDRLHVYRTGSDGTIWLECAKCGAIFPVWKVGDDNDNNS